MASNGKYARVRALFADQLNLARGKYLPPEFAASGECRLCIGVYALTYAKSLVPVPGGMLHEGLPDIEMAFDPKALRPSWEPDTRIALCDLKFQGEPSGLCGRSALRRAVEGWRELGFDPVIGLEGEAYIFQPGGERPGERPWTPYQTPGAFVYGTGPFTDPAGLTADIWRAAKDCELEIESMNTEFDSPQFELTLRHADAMKACDDFFLFRTMAREVLYRRGYLLSFLPAPIPGSGGSGLHINLSFRDKKGANALAGETGRGNLSPLVKGCIAGLLEHHAALGGILAPTANSYARLKPANLCGYWANWSHDHRGVAVRLSGESGAGARIEHRTGDCAASPYFAVAAALQAARLGFVEGKEPPPEETGDSIESANTDVHIADSLAASIDALEKDAALIDAIGRPLLENYIGIKRYEIEEVAGMTEEQIFDYYAPFI